MMMPLVPGGVFPWPVIVDWVIEEYVEVLSGVEDQVKEIEIEIRLMHAYLKHVEALESLGEREKGLADQMTEVAQNATDAVDTFLLKTAQRRRHGFFKRHALFFGDIEDRYILSKKLTEAMSEIHDLLDKKKKYGASSSTSQERAPPSQQGSMSSRLSDLRQKFMILSQGNFHLHPRTVKNVERVANECKHLLWLLKDMELVEQDERLKVWMKDIEDLILFGREVVEPFLARKIEKQRNRDCNFFARATPNLSFNKKIQLIQDKIQEALHRKWAYGIGDIKGKKAQSSTILDLKLERKQKRNHWEMPPCYRTILNFYLSVLLCFVGVPFGRSENVLGKNASHTQVEDEVESICRDLRLMHALLKDIETIEDPDGILNAWVEEVKDVAHDADTTIDTYIKKSKGTVLSSIEPGVSVHKSIKRIRKTINTLSQRRTSYGIKHYGQKHDFDTVIQMQYPSLPVGHPTDTICFGEDVLKAMMARLLSEDQPRHFISIVGMADTALAEYIYNNTVDHFPSRAFVSVPEDPYPTDILEDIVQQVIGSQKLKGKSKQVENPLDQLIALLKNSRYLIVLDAVCREDTWDSLKGAFPDASNGSIVVLTTRNINVASIASPQLQPENNNEGWDSSTKSLMIFLPTEVVNLEHWETAMLKSEERSMTLDRLNLDENPCLEMSGVHNADLPLYLWRCLLYFELFPAKFEIPARRLIALWVAEGLVKKEGEKPLEVVAQEYLEKLVGLKIVQVTKRKDNGNVRTCQLSPDQRDLWLSRAKKDIFLPTSESSLSIGVLRRLSDHLDVTDPSFNHIHDSSTSAQRCYRNVLSFLSFDTREGSKPGEDVGNFLYKSISNYYLQHLRVLDLEGVFRPKLPKEVGELILMRYLGLRWTHLEKLPSCISNLLYLQTLDLKHTYITTLPRSIWKMQKLRHLYLSGSKFVPRPRSGSIEDLQTLRGVFVDEKSPVRGGLDSLVNLRKLGLKCRFMSSQTVAASPQQNAVADWIFESKHLQSLRLTSHNEMGQPGDLHLRSLSTLNLLSSIDFLGRVMNPDLFFELPESLTELTLSATKLTDEYDPMRKLDKLPNLKILRLFSESYTGKNMRCYPRGFPKLQLLKIWDLKDLVDWTVLEGALPTLSTLEIRSCIGLKMLPDGLRHVTSLNGLKLTKMPEIFKARTSDYQGEDWYKIAHIHFVIKED